MASPMLASIKRKAPKVSNTLLEEHKKQVQNEINKRKLPQSNSSSSGKLHEPKMKLPQSNSSGSGKLHEPKMKLPKNRKPREKNKTPSTDISDKVSEEGMLIKYLLEVKLPAFFY